MAREPRRSERKEWPTEVHLGAIDGDLDELHRLRLQSEEHLGIELAQIRKEHADDIQEIKSQFNGLTQAITKLTLLIAAGLVTLVVDILKGTLFS